MVFPAKPGSQKRQHESLEEDAAHDRRGTNGTTACEPALKRRRVFDFGAHPRRKIALQFLYHGWEFDGLVQQASTDNTVEEFQHLMAALLKTKLISGEKDCDFSRCGRTDKGVSAFKQVAAVVVRYTFVDSFLFTVQLHHRLSLQAMRRAAALLIGIHDFRNFCQVDMNEKRVNMSFVREIFKVNIEPLASRFDSENPDWVYDEYALRKTVGNLQSEWANLQTK
ncbi:unnamed protein product [Heligmosomoides polygyrus]|uniref:tRNA pseudouridine synthase n=1 Tax=Heligmosomoides polygyrus TaxID=6339 RepID=A0A3P7ZD79_HELPZ|nr:unnamed protein product [Heligmosomoides polygyrus]